MPKNKNNEVKNLLRKSFKNSSGKNYYKLTNNPIKRWLTFLRKNFIQGKKNGMEIFILSDAVNIRFS